MNTITTGLAALLVATLAPQAATAYSHANRFGGSTSHRLRHGHRTHERLGREFRARLGRRVGTHEHVRRPH